eukprot:scaffold7488_cov149-Isochrysis_galbana.AAC.4
MVSDGSKLRALQQPEVYLGLERLGECGAILCPPYLDPLRASGLYGWVLRKNPAWFSHVARAHRWVAPLANSRPPMAARCEALPSTHLSGIQ